MLVAAEAIHCHADPGKSVAYNIFPAAMCSAELFFFFLVCELLLSLIAHVYKKMSFYTHVFEESSCFF